LADFLKDLCCLFGTLPYAAKNLKKYFLWIVDWHDGSPCL
jgi:hypothetical protein